MLKCLLQLVQNFPRLPEAKISGKYTCFIFCVVAWSYTFAFLIKCRICTAILPSLWQTFVSSFKIYHLSSIQGSEELDSINYDSDGSERSLESFEIQVILRQFPVGHWIFFEIPDLPPKKLWPFRATTTISCFPTWHYRQVTIKLLLSSTTNDWFLSI